jgi:endonuclease-3 related protein
MYFGHLLPNLLTLKQMQPATPEQRVVAMYSILTEAWGRQHWWPAATPFEVIVGAFLTQNTNWTNVEIALAQLRSARGLSLAGIRKIPVRRLEKLVRSSGYFRQKARRLKKFVKFVDQLYGGSLRKMFEQPTAKLREELLALEGVGPETADSVLLYAGQHPVFVVDAYTRRISERHGVLRANASYEEFRALFERGLSEDMTAIAPAIRTSGAASHSPSPMSLAPRSPRAQVFNEMHGSIVGVGKQYCRKSKLECEQCPLKPLLPSSTMTADL